MKEPRIAEAILSLAILALCIIGLHYIFGSHWFLFAVMCIWTSQISAAFYEYQGKQP